MNFLFFRSEYYINGCVVLVLVFFFFFFVFFYWDLELILLTVTKGCHPDFNKVCSSTRLLIFNCVGTIKNITMCSISLTVRSSENVGFNVGDPKGPSCVMALSDIDNDIGVSVLLKRLLRGPRHG